MEIRLNMNRLDTGKGNTNLPKHSPGSDLPWTISGEIELDFRDDETVWVWLSDNLCVEMSKEEIERLTEGFKEQ